MRYTFRTGTKYSCPARVDSPTIPPMTFFQAARRLALLLAFLAPVHVMAENAPVQNAPVKKQLNCKKHRFFSLFAETDYPAFSKAKAEFIDQAVARYGFEKNNIGCIFEQVHPIDKVTRLIRPAPSGQRKNWKAYRARFVDPIRVRTGAAFWDRYETTLARAEKQYGVPAEIIVGIIGVETIYGRNTGNFRIVDALATLAFSYPDTPNRNARMAFFRNELEQTLLFAQEAGIDPLSLRGSYAGAIGWPQFMPGTLRRYGVDFDGDGKIDLLNSPVDAIGSVANYLAEHGWKRGAPLTFPAQVDSTCAKSAASLISQELAARLSSSDLKNVCVSGGTALPANTLFGLVDLQNGAAPTEYWLGTNNFFAITHYNRSFFYAMSVIELGRAVRSYRDGR